MSTEDPSRRLGRRIPATPGEAIELPDTRLTLYRQVWSPAAAGALFARLLAETAWEQHELNLFGRRVKAPRLSAWHGDPDADYGYSGLRLVPRPWTPCLLEVRAAVQALAGCGFNSVLLNRYRDGDDSMGWHSDDEPELGAAPVIASVSLGTAREFRLRRKRGPRLEQRLVLPDASVLVMAGDTQRCWQHSIPKTRRPCAERINLTFRAASRASAARRKRAG